MQMTLEERLQQGPEPVTPPAVGATCPWPGRWTLRTIRASFDWLHEYTLSGVWYLLARHDLALHSARVQLYSPDPAYTLKVKRLKRHLREAARMPGQVELLFLDEFIFYRWPEPAAQWGSVPFVVPRDGNNSQWRLIGALNALTGRTDYLDNYVVGRKQVSAFYAQLEAAYPRAERIYMVEDNWSIHAHPDVLAALATHPRLQVVWLPTYSPWLNPIEKLWRWVRQDVLKLHRRVSDWAVVRQMVRDFLDQFAHGSHELLHYVGLLGDGKLAQVISSA
jgi:transposase